MRKQLETIEITPCNSDDCLHRNECELHETYDVDAQSGNKGGFEPRFLDFYREGLSVTIGCEDYKEENV